MNAPSVLRNVPLPTTFPKLGIEQRGEPKLLHPSRSSHPSPALVRNDVRLIGLCGKMHSGKSTIADTLSEERYWEVRYFAGPVKQIAAKMTNTLWGEVSRNIGLVWGDMHAWDLERDKDRFRPLFQFVGSYGRHAFGEDIWIRMFESLYSRGGEFPEPLVVADVRYPNEAAFLLGHGFDVYVVNRDEKQRKASVVSSFENKHGRPIKKKELKSILSHESETGVDDILDQGLYTDIIRNNQDVNYLQTVARSLA